MRTDNLPYENDYPFDIPDNWLWLKHNDLFEISGGSQPPKSKFINEPRAGYIRLFQIRDYGDKPVPVYIPESTATKITKEGDILLARYGASLGKVFWAENGAYNVAMAKVIPLYDFLSEYVFDKYLFYYYHTDLYRSVIMRNSRSAQAGFNKDDLENMWFPVPPIAEQMRIVNCIEQLLPLVELYRVHEERLINLNDQFPELLKKSILQEAVQGKLVPQDLGDEPASILLEHIRAKKQRLIAEGKIKKDKHESVIFRRDNSHYEKQGSEEVCIDEELPFEVPKNQRLIAEGKIKKDKHESVIFRRDNSHYEKQGSEEVCIDEELPFEVPKNWQWIRLSDLVHFIGGYAYKSETFIETSEYQVLRLGNIKNDKIKYSTKPVFISKELSQKTVDFQCKTNDILLTMTGTRLKRDYFYTVLVSEKDTNCFINQRVGCLRSYLPSLSTNDILLTMTGTRLKRDYFYTVLVSEKDTNCFINQRVGCLRSYLPSLSRWLIWTLKSEAILSQVFQHETGTANQGNLGAENIMKTFIPVPPLDEQERICNVIDRLLREVDTL